MLKEQLRDLRDACRRGSEAGAVTGASEGLAKEEKERILTAMRDNDSNQSA